MKFIRQIMYAVIVIMLSSIANADEPDSLSTFSIPLLKQTPVIDGNINPKGWPNNEWSMALWLSGFSQAAVAEPAPTLDYVLVGYDEEYLYAAFRIMGMDGTAIRCEATGPDTTAWQDESVELHVGVGETPSLSYQFVANADNVIFDAVNCSNKCDVSWNGEWRHATEKTAEGWTAELAIPWKTLGLSQPKAGQLIRINFAHNTRLEGISSAITSSWGNLRDKSGKNHSLDEIACMPIARLADNSAVAGCVLSYDNGSNEPSLFIRVSNPTAKEARLKYNVLNEVWNNIAFSANQWNRHPIPIKTDERGLGSLSVRVRDESGNIVFSHVAPFRAQVSANIALKKYFPVNYVELEIGAVMPKGAQAKIEVIDADGKALESFTKPVEGKVAPLRVDINRMPINQPCMIKLTLSDSAGKTVTERQFPLTRPPIPEWLGTKAGLSDQPLPPYTPIETRGDTFACLVKDYAFKGRALPASMRSESQELLAAPIRMNLAAEGITTDIAAAPINVTTAKVNRVEWTTQPQTVNGITITHTGWIEEDGFMWCEVTLDTKQPVKVEGLELLVPVRRECANFYTGALLIDFKFDDFGRLEGEGHVFEDFAGIISVRNYERGLSVITDDPRPWRPKNLKQSQRIELTGNAAVIRYGMIEKPTTLQGRTTFSMGFMAMPAKPVERNQSQRRMLLETHYYDTVVSCGLGGASRVEYPVKDNINMRAGTLEIYTFADFDATYFYPEATYRHFLSRQLWQVGTDQKMGALFWNAQTRGWQFSRIDQNKTDVDMGTNTALPWQQPSWHHVALSWGDKLRIYSDGTLVAETNLVGLLDEGINPEQAIMRLGKKNKDHSRSEFRIAGLRISNKPLAPADMALDGNFALRSDTVFLHDFSRAPEGTNLPPPQKGSEGKLYDSARIVESHGRKTLTFGPIPDLSRIEYFGKLGVKFLWYHAQWTPDYGSPRVEENKPLLETLLDACQKNGMKPILYFGYGLGHQMPESRLYEDYWDVQPLCPWAGPGRYYFFAANNAVNYYTDFLIDGIQKLYEEYPIGGLCYDHVQTSIPDQSLHNGSGWFDENGKLQPRVQVRPAREYIKRLLAITKQASSNNIIECGGSGEMTPVRAAWVDRSIIGEVFRSGPGRAVFSFDAFTILVVGHPCGMASDYQVHHENLPFTWEQSLTYTMPFDIEPCALAWKPAQVAVVAKLWEIKNAFDTDHAEWHPFWKTNKYARVNGKGCITSLHLYPGKRALVVLSNVSGKGPVETVLKLDLKAMGLKGKAKNTWTGESVVLDDGQATFKLDAHDMRLLWVE